MPMAPLSLQRISPDQTYRHRDPRTLGFDVANNGLHTIHILMQDTPIHGI